MIRLFDLPHHDARSLLRSTDVPVFLTVNPVEFHGPHLSLHNDLHVSAGLNRDLHAALAGGRTDYPYVVAGELEIGVEPCSGPGSRHTRLQHARALVAEACRALVELGARKVVLGTFHGGALHNVALDEGVRLVERSGGRAIAPLALALDLMIGDERGMLDEALALVDASEPEKRALKESLRFDFHAGWLETSLALHYAPETVSPLHRALAPARPLPRTAIFARASQAASRLGAERLATELDFLATASNWAKQRPFVGYTSMPHLARAEVGAVVAREFVRRYAERARAVFDRGEPAPRPPLRWLRYATLDGRLDPMFVPTEDVQEISLS